MIPSRLREIIGAWGPWAFLLLPAGILATSAWAVTANYSPTPYQDQWATIPLWQGLSEGTATARDFFVQHNEHRIFFPRLVFMADFAWFQGRNILNLAAIGAIQAAAAALYLRACGRFRSLTLLAAATSAALMFSLLQWENLFWGFQVQFVGVFAAGAWAIWLFCRSFEGEPRIARPSLIAALLLLGVAAFTLANGLLAGFAMMLTALTARRRPMEVLVVLGATVILLAAYLAGYHTVQGHSPPRLILERPVDYLAYVLIYLGNPWRAGSVGLAVATGLIGVAATAAMGVLVARDGGRDRARAAMFGIVLFIGMTAGVTALGRLSFGVEQALSSRYVTPANHFWAAHAVFWALTAQAEARAWLSRAVASAVIAAGLFLIPFQRQGQIQLADTHERVLAGASALLADTNDLDAIRTLYPDVTIPLQMSPFLRTRRLSLFADAPAEAAGAPFARAITPGCEGGLDLLEPAPNSPTAWRARGRAWDPQAARPFSHVVLTDEAGKVLGVGLGNVLHGSDHGRAGWIGSLSRGVGTQVIAYGLRVDGSACELGRKAWPQA